MQRIGEKIKKIRELRNYTQEYVARELEMSLANYSKIERDEIQLTIDRLEKIAVVFQLNSYLDILTFDEKIFFNIHNNHNGYIHNNYTTTDEIMSRLLALEKRISEIEKND
ncbi:MAG: helix-turn-helix transcriptional regulator [Chitinophagales bacterium]|nr:helix-turn-helix transcriptional regulator [Chitinophagales bacterium]